MGKHRVLIAGHNPLVRRLVRELLSREEFDFYEVTSGAYLLEEVRTVNPNLIILEARLPGPGGRNVLKALKGEDGLRHIPVILLKSELKDGDPGEKAAEEDDREMAFDVILKPIDGDLLKTSAMKALRACQPPHPPSGTVNNTSQKPLIFTDYDFTNFQDFLMRKVGLFFDIKRKNDLARALSRRVRAIGLDSYREYFDYLTHSAFEEKELKNLILHLTIGETTFFRSPDQFVALREFILPEIIKERKKSANPHIVIWSGGCSTGEEPYSLAIALKEIIPDFDRWDVVIHATDINQKFLKFAQRGVYPARKVRFVPDNILLKYFRPEGENFAVDPSLKNYIRFKFHNLSSEDYDAFKGSDIIFCRNVLIYFKRDRIREVIDRFRNTLRKKGYLMLGYSETLFQISGDFISIHYKDAFFYRLLTLAEKEQARRNKELLQGPTSDLSDIGQRSPLTSITTRATVFHSDFIKDVTFPTKPVPPQQPHAPGFKNKPEPDRKPVKPIEGGETAPRAPAPTDPVEEALWEQGMDHYFQEQFGMAETVFEEIGEKFPESAHALLGRAFILANKGQDVAAQETIGKVNDINDLIPETYYLEALLEEKDGRLDAAMGHYRNVILLDPDFAMAHFNLAIIYMKLGRMRDSRREFANTLNILKRYEVNGKVKFSGGLHREALMQLCEDLEG